MTVSIGSPLRMAAMREVCGTGKSIRSGRGAASGAGTARLWSSCGTVIGSVPPRLKLTDVEPPPQAGAQPDGDHVQDGHHDDEQQGGGEHHRPRPLAVAALKADVVNL